VMHPRASGLWQGCWRYFATSVFLLPLAVNAQTGDAELAQELTNPLADLVTIPIQMNFDRNIGPSEDGTKITTNVQIVPIVYQDEIYPDAGSQFGLGDINATFFLSPKKPTAGGLIWGVGPVFLLPTGTDDLLSAKKWGAGPSAVALAMRGPWTVGVLANHVWSFAGDDNRQDINNTFVQPFAAYTWPSAWTVSVQSESTYNWKVEQWSVPANLSVSKLVRIGQLPVSLLGSVGYWFESADTSPEGFRFRLQANIVLPKSVFTR